MMKEATRNAAGTTLAPERRHDMSIKQQIIDAVVVGLITKHNGKANMDEMDRLCQ